MSEHFSLVPHAVCWAGEPHLIWTMAITNAITFLSYVFICFTLLFLVRRTRRVIARDWAWFAVGFALFIVACGSTHLMDVVTTWIPEFWVDAWTSIITAVLSATVAVMLIRRSAIIAFSVNDYADRLANTEAEKQQLRDSLLSARKLEDWSRMTTAVTHEINQPLESIQNLLFLIRTTEGISPEVAEFTRNASEEAERVVTISRSTLAFFRQTNEPEPIDLGAAAQSVGFLLDRHLKSKQIRFEVCMEGDLIVRAFPGETRQVVLNLVRNAYEATSRPGSIISVSLTGSDDAVDIVISDQGSGIPAERLDTLFQFGNSTKGELGNGMGLWTVKQILSRHGGTVEVKSALGLGTQFLLHWPREFTPALPLAEVPELAAAR